jgi:hypothetical protein
MSVVEDAHALQAEAHQLLGELELGTAFPWRPEVIGSALSGLMVVRDLDVMFDAPDASATVVLSGLATLGRRVDLTAVDFRDERGQRRPTPQVSDERFYAVLQVGAWKVDLTFWLHVVARPHVADALRLRDATEEQRLTILSLKQDHHGISSSEIYTAVLDRGVRTVEELLRT